MKMSPLGAVTTLVGSLSASGGLPATPAVPSVISTLPYGLNLTMMLPFAFSSGLLLCSLWFALLASATQMLPSWSTWILWGKMNMPAPKLLIKLPDESNFITGATVEPAQLS
jgi:hypothetical protein